MTATSRRYGRVSGFDRYFSITKRGSTIAAEVRGGLTTFFTVAYIVVLNPIILTGANDLVSQGPPLDFLQVAAMTAGVAGVMTILMGVFGRVPMAMAAGLGLNGVVAYTLAPQMGWKGAMGIVVLEGLITIALVLTKARLTLFKAIPMDLKHAISVGIGLFIALIGLVDAGFVRRIPGEAGTVPLGLGINNQLDGWPVVIFVFTLLLMLILDLRKVKGALLIGIVSGTVGAIVLEKFVNVGPALADPTSTGWGLNVPKLPSTWVAMPDLSLIGNFSIGAAVEAVGWVAVLVFAFSLVLADLFDTMGTIVGVGDQADLLDDEGMLPDTQAVLLVDSIGAAVGGAASVSSNTTYIESATGVGDGARTGLASVVTGLCFLAAMFIVPVISVIPSEAAAAALVVVGYKMFGQVKDINWGGDYAIPAFMAIALMPFTYSITAGIGLGIITLVLVKVVKGKAYDIHPLLWVIAGLFLAYFALTPIERLLGVS